MGSQLRMAEMYWGRLVDVYDLKADGRSELQHKDFVIGPDIQSDGISYVLERNPVTSQVSLTVLADADDEPVNGETTYQFLVDKLDDGLLAIQDQDLDGVGIYSMIPRNAALMMRFDDLLDPDTIDASDGPDPDRVAPVGNYEPRVIADPNHGDTFGGKFFTTRIIVDMTVSELESFESDPPLPVNGVGLPAATSPNLANVALRIPTLEKASIGQNTILRNRTGHKLATAGNGTIDFGSDTVDLVRGMRSGGEFDVTGDPFNGFLRDETPPDIVGRQPVTIGEIVQDPMDWTSATSSCP